jgi:hypothetical protein
LTAEQAEFRKKNGCDGKDYTPRPVKKIAVRLTGEGLPEAKLPLTKDECKAIAKLDLLNEAGKRACVSIRFAARKKTFRSRRHSTRKELRRQEIFPQAAAREKSHNSPPEKPCDAAPPTRRERPPDALARRVFRLTGRGNRLRTRVVVDGIFRLQCLPFRSSFFLKNIRYVRTNRNRRDELCDGAPGLDGFNKGQGETEV